MSSQPSHHLRSKPVLTSKTLICVVCGSIARGYNFGAVTCMSCKMFFRRNALTTSVNVYFLFSFSHFLLINYFDSRKSYELVKEVMVLSILKRGNIVVIADF